tara:strand:+ start:6142 stop:6609 length:468 start_codon:yes stop_codon:yes gene_type:complete
MNKSIITGVVIASLALCSCNNAANDSDTEVTTDTTEVVGTEVEPNPHDLILVDDVKWVIDEGMRVSIDSIEMRMEGFEGSDLAAYEALSADMEHHTKSIFSSCTMTGQAHDGLHKWLLLFIDLRKELNGITEVSEGDAIADELDNELVVFNTYFE